MRPAAGGREVALPSRRIVRVLLLILGVLGFGPVRTSVAETRTIAVYVEGPDAQAARDAVIDALTAGANLVDDRQFRKELTRQGQKKPFGKNVDRRAIERVRRAAGAVGADAVLLVRVRKAQPHAALVLVVESSGGVSADREIRLRVGLKDEDREELRRSLHSFEAEAAAPPNTLAEAPPAAAPSAGASRERTAQAEPPAAAPSTPAPSPMGDTTSAARESPGAEAKVAVRPGRPMDAHAAATSLVDIAIDGELASRRFEYRNGIGPHAFTLSQPAVPAAEIAAEFFPLAATRGPWGDFGFIGDYWMMFSPSWAGTNPLGYDAGMRVRIHPGADAPVLLSLTVGYEFRWFGAYDAGNNRVPEVTYRALRPAVDVRIPMGRFSILAGTGLRAILDPHDISEQFYNPSGLGFDAHAGATVMFLPGFEARLVASYARYSFSLAPPAGATFGTGAAIDQLYGGRLAIAYMYSGSP